MEKPSWHRIERNSSKPCPRWGHSCCVIGDEIVFFGGYADSNYMNDLWTYHATERTWTEVATTGPRPSHRSNCSLNYDPKHNIIVIFGGGGPNKQRFNTISILDWSTKTWREIAPRENEASPWERTYHVAEMVYPYLVVFGGEALTDMEDLWVFNFENERWNQVKITSNPRPCARRFHSSCLIGTEFFVVAGCHSKYRCLSDVYSLDLAPLLQTGKVDQLKWQQRKLKGASFLSRWGHSTAVFDGKIYVFAGRFSSDLNDVLVIDVQSNSLRGLKMGGPINDHPKPRRRHCAGFVGSCMIIFGGFNGQYFNDLHYINVFEPNIKIEQSEDPLPKLLNNIDQADHEIETTKGETVYVHTQLLARYFSSEYQLVRFLKFIDKKIEKKEELLEIIEAMYSGFTKNKNTIMFLQDQEVSLGESLNRRIFLNELLQGQQNERNVLANSVHANEKSTQLYVTLKSQEYQKYLRNLNQLWFMNTTLIVGNTKIKSNKQLLSIFSPYFQHMFSGKFDRDIELPPFSAKLVSIVQNFMIIGVLVVPTDFPIDDWQELARLADYFCLQTLKSVCENQLCSKITQNNCSILLSLASQLQMKTLSLQCANTLLRGEMMQQDCEVVGRLRELLRLQLSHMNIGPNMKNTLMRKGISQAGQEKQNRQCANA